MSLGCKIRATPEEIRTVWRIIELRPGKILFLFVLAVAVFDGTKCYRGRLVLQVFTSTLWSLEVQRVAESRGWGSVQSNAISLHPRLRTPTGCSGAWRTTTSVFDKRHTHPHARHERYPTTSAPHVILAISGFLSLIQKRAG